MIVAANSTLVVPYRISIERSFKVVVDMCYIFFLKGLHITLVFCLCLLLVQATVNAKYDFSLLHLINN